MFIDVRLARKQFQKKELEAVTDEDLKKINSLNRNGPLRELKKEDINTRSIVILGEEPTTKMSIHPQGELNGRSINSLSQIAKLLPGSPMMIGHRMDKEPWGRTFEAAVLEKGALPGYTGSCLHEKYWFLADEEGNGIARKIDAGIWSEGSISYWFKEARCSICHKPMVRGWCGTESGCSHKIGEKDKATGQVCYWYPHNVQKIAETSYVFAGAYQKTRSMLSADGNLLKECYSDDEIESGKKLEETLIEYGLNPDDMIVDFENNDINSNKDGENATENSESPDKGIKPQISSQSVDGGEKLGSEKSGESKDDSGQKRSENQDVENEAGSADAENSESSEGAEESEANSKTSADQNSEENSELQGEETGSEEEINEDSEETSEKEGTEASSENSTESTDSTNRAGTAESGDVEQNTATSNKEQIPICDDINKGNEGKNADSSANEADSRNNAIKNSGEAANGVDGGSSFSDTTSFLSKLTEEQTSEVMEIYYDVDLEFDEKEIAVKELLNGDTELVSAVLDEWSENRHELNKVERLRVCPDCRNKESQGCDCDDCGGELIDRIQFANRLFKPVGSIRPEKAGSVNNEHFNKDTFKDLPNGEYIVEPNYSGVWVEVHCNGDTVKIFTENGEDCTVRFPGIVSEVKESNADGFVLVGKMTRWRGRKRLTQYDVIKHMLSDQENYDDKEFKFKPFDMVVKDGKDISRKTLSDRRKILDDTFKWGKQLHPTAIARITHEKGGGQIVAAIEDRKTRDGAIIRSADSKYCDKAQAETYKWKQPFEIDCRVAKANEESEGGFTYECEIGRGTAVKSIGKTFVTKLSVKIGGIVTVNVDSIRYDSDNDIYTWFTPVVTAYLPDKKLADPISVVKRLAEVRKSGGRSKNIISLAEVVPKLKKTLIDFELFLGGAIVEKGVTTQDVDIIVRSELTEEQNDQIITALGERIAPYVNVIIEENGPSGPCVPIIADMAIDGGKVANSDSFVVQRHGWGKKEHWDIRFGAPKSPRLWGYACFSKPTTAVGGAKTRCQEKKYHDPKWLSVDDKKILPGNPGNPNKSLSAHMIKEDEGKYSLIRQTSSFLEIELHGEKFKGRYLFREIAVKKAENSQAYKIEGDEVSLRNDKTWVMWKPREQELNSPVKKIAFKSERGVTVLWESDEIDKEVENK